MVAAVNTPMVAVGLTALLVLGMLFLLLGISSLKSHQRSKGAILIVLGILVITAMVVSLILILIK